MRVQACGPARPEDVWERYTDPELWPSWAPQIKFVRRAHGSPGGLVAPGMRGTVHGPLLLRVPFRVVAVDHAAHRWTWRVGVGRLAVTMDHGVDPAGADEPEGRHQGSCAWLRIHVPLPVAASYLPLAHLALRRLVAA
ncbi:MAG TPA: SRPBCC family protein [Nocardioides sp.]|nr:SRPBCC family protein [Nocardioides sp.]